MKRITLALILFAGLTNITTVSGQAKIKTAAVDYHQTAKTRFLEAGGTRFAYRVLGNKGGIPLVMLQGSFFSMDEWDPKITNGLATYFKVILFDNKGVGATNGKTPASIAEMAKDATSFIKALGYGKVNLMGFSMGGMITQRIVLDEPQLVNKFILAGTGPKGSEGLSQLVDRLTEVGKLAPDDQLMHLLFTQSDRSKALGKQFLSRIHKRTVNRDPAPTNESNGAQVAAVVGWGQPDGTSLDQLAGITQPALIVEGRYDRLVPVVNSFNMFQNMPNAKLSLYQDAAHGSIFQFPGLFLAEAVPFLAAK